MDEPVQPLQTNDRLAVGVGCAVWAALLVASLWWRADLQAAGRGWWVWCCASGFGLGLAGLAWLTYRHRRAPLRA